MLPARRPYPDELIFSAVLRCARQFNLTLTRLGWILSDSTRWRPSFLGIYNVQALSDLFRMPPESLLWLHTGFPYATRFLPKEKYEQAFKNAMGVVEAPKRAGNTTYTLTAGLRYRRFCRRCAEREFANTLESYWHRSHNLPGVWACSEHQVYLTQTDVALTERGLETFLLPHECKGTTLGEDGALTFSILTVSRLSESWMHRKAGTGRPLQRGRYERIAVVAGWPWSASDLSRAQLNQLLSDRFPTSLLREAEPKCRPLCVNWTSKLFDGQDAGSFIPAKHAILQSLLTGGPTAELPFGPR